MTTWNVAAAIAACLLLASCSARQSEEPTQRRPQQAGQPMDPMRTASHMASARAAAILGDQQGVQRNVHAMSEDMRLAMKLPDPARPINPEAARGIARAMPGVRSANWIDRTNLLVRVDGADMRTQQTIDELCVRLEPLGDTLAVVVHLQNAAAANRDQMDTLSRNCQLAEGDHAMLQRSRTVDALDPLVRAQHRAEAERMRGDAGRIQSAGDRAALNTIPEM
jgi:hypothetical protein